MSSSGPALLVGLGISGGALSSALFGGGGEEPAPAAPDNPDTVTVSQGDRIFIGNETGSRMACTAGFVDREGRKIFTARHCMTGEGAAFDDAGRRIGQAYFHGNGDVAEIDLDRKASGENKFSTDDYPVIPNQGDRVCSVGATTHTVRCDAVDAVDDNGSSRVGPGILGQKGDSGGPVWKEDTGELVGIYRGVVTTTFDDGHAEEQGMVESF